MDGIHLVDFTGHIIYANKANEKIYGYSANELVGKHVNKLNADNEFDEAAVIPAIRETGRWDGELRAAHKDGHVFPIWLTAALVKDDQGNPISLLGIVRDITERKKAEEQLKSSLKEKDILLKEIHHRVKNNLQIVASMLQLQSGYIKDKESKILFEESQKRVETMSLIHEKLYRSQDLARIDFREYVDGLVENLLTLNAGKSKLIEMNMDIKGVVLDIINSIPCGLIINELVSNSLRHAFPNGKKGRIDIHMNVDKQGMVSLSVSDNGTGFPENVDFRNTQSLGMQLVSSLVNQLSGKIDLDRNEGTCFRIEFRA